MSVLVVCAEPSVSSTCWFYMESALCCVFTLELSIHLAITTDRTVYVTSPFGIMDIFAMLSSLCSILSYLSNDSYIIINERNHNIHNTNNGKYKYDNDDNNNNSNNNVFPQEFVTFTKIFRLVRLFKFTRVSRGLQQFVYVLYASRDNLSSFFTILAVSCLACAIFVQNSEDLLAPDPTSDGHTVEVGFLNWVWFAFITASGVGYGDYYPKSAAGKICGVALSIGGVWIFCLPASLLVGKFVQLYYLPDVGEVQVKGEGQGQGGCDKQEKQRKQLISYTRDVYFAEEGVN